MLLEIRDCSGDERERLGVVSVCLCVRGGGKGGWNGGVQGEEKPRLAKIKKG